MEQIMVKASRPLQMMKALLLSYAITGILLLGLAFLLYKLGLGESQVNLGIMVTYIISCLAGGFYMGRKGKKPAFSVGDGAGIRICSSSMGGDLSYRTFWRGFKRDNPDVFYLHSGRSPGRNVVLERSRQKKYLPGTKSYAIIPHRC